MKLTPEEVDSIISAIEIAEDEIGGNYGDIKKKLEVIYPKAKQIREEREKKWKQIGEKQTNARKMVTDMIFNLIKKDKPVIPQIQSLYSNHLNEIRKNYSDDICLPADLFKYYLPELKNLGLIAELKDYVNQQDGDWLKKTYRNAKDIEFWHVLVRIMEE